MSRISLNMIPTGGAHTGAPLQFEFVCLLKFLDKLGGQRFRQVDTRCFAEELNASFKGRIGIYNIR